MRINLVGNFRKNTGLMQDGSIIRGLLTCVFGEEVSIFRVPHQFPHCQEADVNIFIEVLNPSLFSYSGRNIWIPNLEWTYRTWEPYVTMFDEIWVKTQEASHVFRMLCEGTSTKVVEIGWTSIDKALPEKKNYSKAIVPVGKNIFRNPKQLFRAYDQIRKTEPDFYAKLPHLYVPYNPDYVTLYCPDELSSKITMMNKELGEQEYDDLLEECGLAVCLSVAEGFGHAVNEAMSSGCNLILSPIGPFRELTDGMSDSVLFTEASQTIEQPECMGFFVDSSLLSIIKALKTYVGRDFKSKKNISELSRSIYEKRHLAFVERMKSFLPSLDNGTTYELKNHLVKEDDLPDVSIVTLTKDRRIFMPLAKYSYMIQSYPEDKLEWVIVDDGEDSIEDTLFGVPNVKYVRCDPGLTIGEKRNVGVQNAMYDTIVMMDDDDVYPNNSVLHRVAMMLKSPRKECVFSTTIPCYDIKKFSSFMNVPPLTLRMSERVSEATLAFTKKFWEANKFDNIHIAEGNAFIHGRESMCREVSPQEVIVSLCHPKNTSSRKIPDFKEPNGCHYGFNEKLFALVSEIGDKI
jgi:hypothetical protein